MDDQTRSTIANILAKTKHIKTRPRPSDKYVGSSGRERSRTTVEPSKLLPVLLHPGFAEDLKTMIGSQLVHMPDSDQRKAFTVLYNAISEAFKKRGGG